MFKCELIYFKPSGKYYTSGEYMTEHTLLYDVVSEIKEMKRNGHLPGLVTGATEFIVLIPTQEPWGVPHIIP